jgi:hypothetical protein
MTRAYSIDLRERVVASMAGGPVGAVDGGLVWGERCECCEVVAAQAADGECRAGQGGRAQEVRPAARARLAARAGGGRTRPDAESAARRAARARRQGELRRAVAVPDARGTDLPKKSLFATEQDRPWIARRRAQWKKYQGRLDPRRLVFIDEKRALSP